MLGCSLQKLGTSPQQRSLWGKKRGLSIVIDIDCCAITGTENGGLSSGKEGMNAVRQREINDTSYNWKTMKSFKYLTFIYMTLFVSITTRTKFELVYRQGSIQKNVKNCVFFSSKLMVP